MPEPMDEVDAHDRVIADLEAADPFHMGPPWTWEPGDRDPQPDTNPPA